MTLWIGPAGALRSYEPYAADEPRFSDVIVGGDHDGLTGSSTRDVWGRYCQWKLGWPRLIEYDVAHLSATSRGDAGTAWLVDLSRLNRCRLQPQPWTSADGAVAGRGAAPLGPSSLDLGWMLTGSSGASRVWLSSQIPALPAGKELPLVASVTTAGAAGVALVLETLSASGVVLGATAASTAANAAAATLACFSSTMPPADPANPRVFWRLRLTVPAAATVQVAEQQLATAGVDGFRPAGGSARVRLVDAEFGPTDPPWWVGSLTAREY